jgi:hypothetical protein
MSDMTIQVSADFAALAIKAWQGEVYGVEVFGALAERRSDPQEVAKLLELVELEAHMEQRLAGMLVTLGIEPDFGTAMATAEADISAQARSSWAELLTWLTTDADVALSEYLPMLDLAPENPFVRDIVVEVVEHERALLSFCSAEILGAPDSLTAVRALLDGAGEA